MAERKPFLRVTEVNEELAQLLGKTKHWEVTEEEYREQTISFAYGNAMSDSITKESVRRTVEDGRFRPKRPNRVQVIAAS